ncbi:MAG: phage head closure protein [Janthinobacterium lividum]
MDIGDWGYEVEFGQLDRKIVIEAPVVERNRSGGRAGPKRWLAVARPWAAIKPIAGEIREMTPQGGQMPFARTEFTIRVRPGIDESMRIRYRGKAYRILHVGDPFERRDRLVLTCDTGTLQGASDDQID